MNWRALFIILFLQRTDGKRSIKVCCVDIDDITLKFDKDIPSDIPDKAFADYASEKIFEDKNKGMLA